MELIVDILVKVFAVIFGFICMGYGIRWKEGMDDRHVTKESRHH